MKIILTGATGYVGEGVMLELLRNEQVEKVLSVSRRPVEIEKYCCLTDKEKQKLEEYIIQDMMTLKENDPHFPGYDAVFFIAGMTSIGTTEDVYKVISYDIPTHFADIMPDKNSMTFIYLSGAGTNPEGKQWWMKIKGATEQYIAKAGFRNAFAYRPAFMSWAKGQHRMQKMQYAFILFFPIMRLFGGANTMKEVALSMIVCSQNGYKKFAVCGRDIARLTKMIYNGDN